MASYRHRGQARFYTGWLHDAGNFRNTFELSASTAQMDSLVGQPNFRLAILLP